MNKSDKIVNVARCALSLVAQIGLDKLTHSNLARSAKVSRAWLYKYVGTQTKDVVDFAVDYFGAELTDTIRPQETDYKGWVRALVKGTEDMIKKAEDNPWLLLVYFKYYRTSTPVGERILKVKDIHISKVTKELMHIMKYSKEEAAHTARVVTATQMSLVYHYVRNKERTAEEKRRLLLILKSWFENLPSNLKN